MILAKGKWLAVLTAAVLLLAMLPAISFGSDVSTQAIFMPDGWESDDTTATAKVLPEMSYHTFHNVDASHVDTDYAKISSPATGTVFYLEAQNTSEYGQNLDMWLAVVDEDGTVLKSNDDLSFWTYDSGLTWTAPGTGTYYVKVWTRPGEYGAYYLYIMQDTYGRRLAGSTRYDTSVEVSKRLFTCANNVSYADGPPYVVVASGRGYADALAGGVLASLDDGPLLLTDPGMLPGQIADEIDRVTYGSAYAETWPTVYVLGGAGAVSEAVMTEIEGLTNVAEVKRLAGANRYGTAAEVASQTAADYGPLSKTAFVVGGFAWPDALAAGPVSAYNESALLLTGKSDVPKETEDALSDLGIVDVVVVGGTGVVDATTFTKLESLVSGDVTRVAGATRYDTARAVAQWGVDEYGMNGQFTTLCSGRNYPDALSAAPISWWTGGPMLLTGSSALHPAVKTFIDDNGRPADATIHSYAVGGSGVISDAILTEWQTYEPTP